MFFLPYYNGWIPTGVLIRVDHDIWAPTASNLAAFFFFFCQPTCNQVCFPHCLWHLHQASSSSSLLDSHHLSLPKSYEQQVLAGWLLLDAQPLFTIIHNMLRHCYYEANKARSLGSLTCMGPWEDEVWSWGIVKVRYFNCNRSGPLDLPSWTFLHYTSHLAWKCGVLEWPLTF